MLAMSKKNSISANRLDFQSFCWQLPYAGLTKKKRLVLQTLVAYVALPIERRYMSSDLQNLHLIGKFVCTFHQKQEEFSELCQVWVYFVSPGANDCLCNSAKITILLVVSSR